MGMGFIGYRCRACRLCFNSYWNSVTWEFGGSGCPECGASDSEKLPFSVVEWTRDELPQYDPEFDGEIPPQTKTSNGRQEAP